MALLLMFNRSMLKSPAITVSRLALCRFSSIGMNSFVKYSYRLFVSLGGLYTFPSISDLFDSIFAISINCPSHI